MTWSYLFHFLRSIRQRVIPRRVRVPSSACIVSPGGVATTMLLEHTATYAIVNDANDRDGVKHALRLQGGGKFPIKVLYVCPNDTAWISSLDRRGYLTAHAGQLGAVGYFLKFQSSSRIDSLTKAAHRQLRYLEKDSEDVRVINPEDMWTQTHEIADFLGIQDPGFEREFPSRQERRSESRPDLRRLRGKARQSSAGTTGDKPTG